MQIAAAGTAGRTASTVSSQKPAKTQVPVYEIARTVPSDTWAETEVIRDRDDLFTQREFNPRTKHRNAEVIKAFGTDSPHSGDALLHYAGAPAEGTKRQGPVLLVHGASKDGNFFWDPKEDGSNKGLAQRLKEEGYDVYSLTFAHNQDDNFVWAEQIANGLAEIKKDQNVEKVKILAHSKGVQAARIYVEGLRKEGAEMTPYQNDVDKIVLVGGANNGVDYIFRHPSANYALAQDSDDKRLNAPTSWERVGVTPFTQDISDMGFGSEYYPGQKQLLKDLSDVHGLSAAEPDWYTTYHGGTGFVSESKGIQHYVDEGDNMVDRLNASPPPEDVQVALLAGNRANIPGILNEYTGPSDGLVFVSSALTMPEGTNVIAREVLPLHHKDLIAEQSGQDKIVELLGDVKQEEEKVSLDQALARASAEWKKYSPEKEAAEQVKALTALQKNPKVSELAAAPVV